MYIPASFAAPDPVVLHELIETHAFGTLVSTAPDGLVATHLPFLLDRRRGAHGTLVGHLARGNPHWRTLAGGEALVIFVGPHGYVSPSWYVTHPSVPTWNYAAIHAYGGVRLVEDEAALRAIVAHLVEKYERGRPTPWSMAALPDDYTRGMLTGIVGIEIEITRLEGKLKLSQNRGATDRRNVIAALARSESAEERALADYMARRAAPEPA